MSSLAQRQTEFMAQLCEEEAPITDGWTSRYAQGLAIYRNNYRVTLVDALSDTFERTARWVGQDAFHQAAAHHVIAHPPAGWTLDDVGQGFDVTLAALFANDPEVSELAWVEWSMHQAFGALDAEPLTAAGFAAATSEFDDEDWSALCLSFVPRTVSRIIWHDIGAIWHALDAEVFCPPEFALSAPGSCHVYREGERPTFLIAPASEHEAIKAMMDGASFGDIIQMLAGQSSLESAAAETGAMLGRWLHNGLICDLR
ncbi:putative DNA-binding domain-containing protein [Sphingorhabdus sp.]|uniref:HvfC/BufC family peptide modification chaperone n=1 Tax=Sphingorhabdus sp. TaxID=1902408 RepID=UPI0039839F50